MKSRNIYQYQPLWDKWQVDELIGQGVFGKVYRVSHQEYGLTYISAVKMISIPNKDQYREAKSLIGSDANTIRNHFQEMVQSLANEVNILYSLSGNSNILGYHDHKIIEHKDKLGWDILIRMEYAKPLSKLLTEKQLAAKEVIALGIDLCSALEICARHGIIHRDIKDENIFISEEGIFKLGDFGIAMKLSQDDPTAVMWGTPHFMAPEVFHGDSYDASVDIYSLGIVMYRLFNHGRLPFMPPYPETIRTDDHPEPLARRMRGERFPKPDQAGHALAKVIMTACAYDKKDRYMSPVKMKIDLESVLANMSDASRNKRVTLISTLDAASG
jgi:serine/threonine protein kinase